MSKKKLIRRLQISCLGLDAVDPLRLLVDDVIEALAQTQRTWVGLTDKDWNRSKHNYDFKKGADWAESILKEKNT